MKQSAIHILAVLFLTLSANTHADLAFETFFSKHSMPMMIIAVEDGQILRANPAARAFYGFSEVAGMNINQINTLTPDQVEQEMHRAATLERNHLFFRHRLADGQVRVMGVYSEPFEYRGQDTLISAVYDTSDFDPAAERHYIARVEEQVDLQTEQLQQAKTLQFWLAVAGALTQTVIIAVLIVVILRLRRAYRKNDELLGELSFRNGELERLGDVMAHHFQEPSRRLVSLSQQLVRRDAAPDRLQDQAVVVGFIQEQARRLSELVSDVQRYLGLDRARPVMTVLDTGSVLEQAYAQTNTLADMRQQARLETPAPLPAVYFDHRRLVLIFRILLHNAWVYRRADRPLVVRITAGSRHDRIELRIADNGSGIAPEYRLQALELFTRLVPTASEGTGMGLALVAKALRPVGGRIRIEDGMDGGTAIIFDLPAAR